MFPPKILLAIVLLNKSVVIEHTFRVRLLLGDAGVFLGNAAGRLRGLLIGLAERFFHRVIHGATMLYAIRGTIRAHVRKITASSLPVSAINSWSAFVAIVMALVMPALHATEILLETDGILALHRVTLPLGAVSNRPSASVHFDVVFGTDEDAAAGEFIDSFTVTLRNSNRTVVATVLTVDRFGVTWLPETPGALSLSPHDLQFEQRDAPGNMAHRDFLASYSVAVNLPAALVNEPGLLVATLFDNQDEQPSAAVVSNIRLRLGLGSPIALESSAAVAGGFATESAIAIDRLRQTVTVPRNGVNRFFRARSAGPSRIASIRRQGADTLIKFDSAFSNLHIESSASVTGPFSEEPFTAPNNSDFSITLPRGGLARFYRLVAEIPLSVRRIELSGENIVLSYEER